MCSFKSSDDASVNLSEAADEVEHARREIAILKNEIDRSAPQHRKSASIG